MKTPSNRKLKPLPSLQSNEAAEEFIASADLTKYDLTGGVRLKFEFEELEKNEAINMRLPSELLNLLRAKTKNMGLPYSKYMRYLIEQDLFFGKT